MVRNESIRFGRHIDIEISYKFLCWKYQNWFKFCTIRLAFKRGYLAAILSKIILKPLNTELAIHARGDLTMHLAPL